MHLLSDSTWSSCFARSDLAWLSKWSLYPSRRDPLKFDGWAFLNTDLLIKFPCSDGNNASGFPEAFWPSDEWDLKLSFPAWVNCALTSLSCTTNASGFTEAFWAYSGEVSIFCNSPSSRSESAVLSAESSKCICDWMLNVSDILESGKPAVPISPNSSTSSVIRAWWPCSPNSLCASCNWYGSIILAILETVASSFGS